jgi:hypothetical protein
LLAIRRLPFAFRPFFARWRGDHEDNSYVVGADANHGKFFRSPFAVYRLPFAVYRSPFTVYRLPFTVYAGRGETGGLNFPMSKECV